MFLTEDNLPGGKLKFANVKDNNLARLKRWLSCRNLKILKSKTLYLKNVFFNRLLLKLENSITSSFVGKKLTPK